MFQFFKWVELARGGIATKGGGGLPFIFTYLAVQPSLEVEQGPVPANQVTHTGHWADIIRYTR